ncbi:MAG: sulfotransferase family protein [Bryobacteraceae bacterium]
MGENLIFVVSQPRAGSTLLQKVLGAHPEIHTVSEPWIALYPLFALRERGVATDYVFDLARVATRDFLRRLPEGEEAYWEGVRRMLNHLYTRSLVEGGKRIFLDKTPRYYFVIPELRHVFPRARFVFLLRNPLAVLSSILETWVKTDNPLQLRGFRHDLMVAPWLLLEGIRGFGPTAIVVRYEHLVREPEAAIRRLCGELGIDFHAGTIEYGAATGRERWQFGDQDTVYRESHPVPDSAERWRSVLKQSPVWEGLARSYLESLGADLVRNLGYDYGQLFADFSTVPASTDWEAITRSDALA